MGDPDTRSVGLETPPGSGSLRIFDRERTGHPWQRAFEDLSRPDPRRRWAVVENWRMDHRLSEGRETGDLGASGHFATVIDGEDWWEARGSTAGGLRSNGR